MATVPTATAPMAPTPARRNEDGKSMCWKRTQTVWATVPAPWGAEVAGDWFAKQPRRLVFNSCTGEFDPRTPTLCVYAIGDRAPSDASAVLVGVLMGGEVNPVHYNRDDCDMVFLCDWPALPRLVAEYAPLLKFHQPQEPTRERIEAERSINDAVARLTAARAALLGEIEPTASPNDQ